jgi:hypothetical protein
MISMAQRRKTQQENYQTFIVFLLIMKVKTIFTLFVRKSLSKNYCHYIHKPSVLNGSRENR